MTDSQLSNLACVVLLACIGGIALARAADAQSPTRDVEVQDCVVQFSDEVEVPALESGRVAELHVRTNESVSEGGPILRLDDNSMLIRRKAAQVRLESAKRDSKSRIELEFAQAALEEADSELKLNLRIEKNEPASNTRDRMRQLRLSQKRALLEVARAQQRIDQAFVTVELQESEIAVLDDQLRRLHADSPLSGIVLDVAKSKGEWVEKGQTVATIARIDRLHVHAFIQSSQIAATKCVGLPVSVSWRDTAAKRSRVLHGKVISVDPHRLPGSRYRIHAEIVNAREPVDQSHWQLNPGMDVRMVVHKDLSTKRSSTAKKLLQNTLPLAGGSDAVAAGEGFGQANGSNALPARSSRPSRREGELSLETVSKTGAADSRPIKQSALSTTHR